ncbi:MAG: hypothetical protein U5P41_10385 [Gammaproteobacteria bacterium]|nr:hypothetical protein [Gammaproteobacteria bacterium]
MSTSRDATAPVKGLWLAVLIAFALLPGLARAERLDRAIRLYDTAEYSEAVELLEQVVADSPSSRAYHWLGKSYGNLADQSGPFQALKLAHMTREALEKAVKLDANNRRAMEDLAKFYRQAPAIVGGSQEHATRLEEKLTAMEKYDGRLGARLRDFGRKLAPEFCPNGKLVR